MTVMLDPRLRWRLEHHRRRAIRRHHLGPLGRLQRQIIDRFYSPLEVWAYSAGQPYAERAADLRKAMKANMDH